MMLVTHCGGPPELRELDAAFVVHRELPSGTYSEMPQMVGVNVTGMLRKFVNLVRRTKLSLMQPNDRFHITFRECFCTYAHLIIGEEEYLKISLVNFH
jgi:hypothetical protein